LNTTKPGINELLFNIFYSPYFEASLKRKRKRKGLPYHTIILAWHSSTKLPYPPNMESRSAKAQETERAKIADSIPDLKTTYIKRSRPSDQVK